MVATFRNEHQVHAGRAARFQVALERPRIPGKIFVRTELRWIDEDGGDDESRLRAGGFDQTYMPGVQCPHRRHEAHRQPALARIGDALANGSSIVLATEGFIDGAVK